MSHRKKDAGKDAPQAEMSLRQRSKRDKLSRIVKAAKTLFQQVGFESTTTQAVAIKAEIGVGTLFSYVKTKEDLLILVFLEDLLDATERARRKAAAATDVYEKVFVLFSGLLKFHYANVDLSLLLLREVGFIRNPERRSDARRLMLTITATAELFIMEARPLRGRGSELDCGLLAQNCFAIYYSTLIECLNSRLSPAIATTTLRKRLDMQLAVLPT